MQKLYENLFFIFIFDLKLMNMKFCIYVSIARIGSLLNKK